MTFSPVTSIRPSRKEQSYEAFLRVNALTQEDMDRAALSVSYTDADMFGVEVRESPINGLGLFATKDIDGAVGLFHDEGGFTTLGRCANHANEPNGTVISLGSDTILRATVKAGEEITVNYFDVKQSLHRPHGVSVVDEFCPDIERVVQSVHNAGFATWLPNKGEVGSSIYEGMGFWGDHAAMLRPLIINTGSLVVPNSMFFRSTNVGMEKAYIHSDRETGDYTCVAYLSAHEEPTGTAFFRHKPTGLVEMPSFDDMRDEGIFEQIKQDMVSRDPSKWEMLHYIDGAYNRALIFDAPLFHSRYPLEGIGHSAEEGRLVWVSNFYKMHANGEFY